MLRAATEALALERCPSPRVEAEHLLAHALGTSRAELYADPGRQLSEEEAERFRALVARRGAHREPLAYILGEWGFRRLTLRVDSRALIPRPETEILVERCLARIAALAAPRVLDVGVGSGAIALSIADEHPRARVTAIDTSRDALSLARENAEASGLAARVTLAERDAAGGLGGGEFDLVVSNPPYVTLDELERLEPEVREWEPRAALVDRDQTEAIARGACEALRRGGWLVLEVADGKARAVAALLRMLGYADVAITRDLAGRERVVEGRRP